MLMLMLIFLRDGSAEGRVYRQLTPCSVLPRRGERCVIRSSAKIMLLFSTHLLHMEIQGISVSLSSCGIYPCSGKVGMSTRNCVPKNDNI